jgi:hypothetical protein
MSGGYGAAGTRVQEVGTRAAGTTGFFRKNGDRPFSNPYPFTRLYPDTDNGHGFTGTGCTSQVLANLYIQHLTMGVGGVSRTWDQSSSQALFHPSDQY